MSKRGINAQRMAAAIALSPVAAAGHSFIACVSEVVLADTPLGMGESGSAAALIGAMAAPEARHRARNHHLDLA